MEIKYTLNKPKNNELKVIAKIYIEEFSKPPYNENWTQEKSLEKIHFFFKFYDTYSVKVRDEIIGFVVINPNFMCPGEVAFMEEFAIKENFQGKGIGSSVLKEIMIIYKKKGFKRLMGISNTKTKAFQLYTKLKIKPSKEDILIEMKLK